MAAGETKRGAWNGAEAGVVPVTGKALRKAGLTLDGIDLFEVNEAFSSVVLAWRQETGAAPAKVNVHSGEIAIGHPLGAIGHPLGASGTRLTTTLVHAVRTRDARYALQTMCEAGGLRTRQHHGAGERGERLIATPGLSARAGGAACARR